MVVIPKGSFRMGSPKNEPGRFDDEGPVHEVSIGYDLAVGKYPVTRGEWRHYLTESGRKGSTGYVGFNPNTAKWEEFSWSNPGYPQDDSHPVVCVRWEDVAEYCIWMSEKTGHRYRVLSEAEFEYVQRAGRQTAYFWGDESDDMHLYTQKRLNLGELKGTWPVGRFKPNPFGLHDTTGLVWCWLQDRYHNSYDEAPQDGSAWEEGDGWRVARGGSWDILGRRLRSACRWCNGDVVNVIGARLARTAG
jgi:formylglycine-generating enzyme required for sulfatase activity